ncbi:Uncharacterized protein FWK35_00012666 [Aphis craccivora]|uniref:Uncharacterized protein n=1 Tax=Aphis craccivora TaxID=307492 RepID=A0A6G0Z4F1_APHCR|nr:Uncharacterized protein FWK35_00012666 [Aphis craccivora]
MEVSLRCFEEIPLRGAILVTACMAAVPDVLHAEIIRRFGLFEQVKPIAFATIMDLRFKNLHLNDPISISSAMEELRRLLKPDISSSESEGDVTTSKENVEIATSVQSERLFSNALGIMAKTRNRLTGSRLEKILFSADLH